MSTRLVILGLLRERALYGYEIKSIIEEHMGDWTNIAFGSIYFALGKLADEGFIEKVSTEQPGNRPSRSIYQITDSGRDEFTQLLRKVWDGLERQFHSFDIGLFFMNALPRDEVHAYLQKRLMKLRMALQHLDDHERDEAPGEKVPVMAAAIFEHSRLHLQAELTWTEDLLTRITASNL